MSISIFSKIKNYIGATAKTWEFKKSENLSGITVNSIETTDNIHHSSVDSYWNEHTVRSEKFKSAKKSLKYLEWRFEQYPQFQQMMDLYGSHDNEVVLDFGCGPGNDLVGFLNFSNAKKVIGIDISSKALELAAHRLQLHDINPERIQLIQNKDSLNIIPLDSKSVDYIYCEGVLHHTSEPDAILNEFYRVLKPNSQGCIMVYNRQSIWFHLYVAYDKIILQNFFNGLSVEEAFCKTTDGESCPIARCYDPEDFISLCNNAGFKTKFEGGYLSLHELDNLKRNRDFALNDLRLLDAHSKFLNSLSYDENGYPLYKGKYAGIGGVYKLYKTG